jgi:accessory colonization factor AcfC
MLMSVSGMACGADIRVLGIDVVQDAVRALAEEFGKETGQQVELTFDSAQGLQERSRGTIFDALIASRRPWMRSIRTAS